MPKLSRVVSVALAAVMMTGVGTASAATTGFIAQAEKAGLSGSQARALQREVDGYLARTHGKQVSANKVVFKGGTVVVAAPGQRYARDLADPAAPEAATCPMYYFCEFSGTYETGTQVNCVYDTSEIYYTTWTSMGSWINNIPPDQLHTYGEVDMLSPTWLTIDFSFGPAQRDVYDWSTTMAAYTGYFVV